MLLPFSTYFSYQRLERKENLKVEELSELLSSRGFEPAVIQALRTQKVNGLLLLEMNDEDMIEVGIEAWGHRKRLRNLVADSSLQPPSHTRREFVDVRSTLVV